MSNRSPNTRWASDPAAPRDRVTGVAPQLTWPALDREPAPPLLVYLDLNHWIGLAQAATGHATGAKYTDALAACRRARIDNVAVFPLSNAHYVEMLNIKDPAQRSDLAQLMEELSGFTALLGRPAIYRAEFEAILDELMGVPLAERTRGQLVGYGVGWTHNSRRLSLSIVDTSEILSDAARKAMGAEQFDTLIAQFELETEREILSGPSDAEVPELQAYGWDPAKIRATTEQRAKQEQEQAERLDANPKWRRGRLRDLVCAWEVNLELLPAMNVIANRRGIDLGDVFTDLDQARALVRSMPSSEAAIEMKTAAYRNPEKVWTPNDINDIDALCVAVPYCDIVVTEKHAHHVLTTAKFDTRMNTVLLRRLEDLPDYLQ